MWSASNVESDDEPARPSDGVAVGGGDGGETHAGGGADGDGDAKGAGVHWLPHVPVMSAAAALVAVMTNLPEEFNMSWLLILLVLFNTLVVASKTIPRATNALRIAWRPLAGATHDRRRIDAVRDQVGEESYSHLSYTARHGIRTLYGGAKKQRVQRPLPSAARHTALFW